MRRLSTGFAVAALAAILFSDAAAGQDMSPRTVVENFHTTLLDTMKSARSLGIKGRYRTLEPRIANLFHLRMMIAIATGRYWRKARPKQRDHLAQAFKRLSVGTYASRFSSYSGESFETAGIKPGPRHTVLVNTRLNRTDDSPVRITYVVKKFGGAWRIVDVVVKGGISELAVRRSEYATTLKQGGVNALISALNKKADGLVRK